MGSAETLDAVQPMKAGWYIYMMTQTDCNVLVSRGINVAGQHVALCSELRSQQTATVKVTLKDLPLHSIANEQVLEAIKEYCKVASEVRYANLWFEGKMIGVCNGDHFIYIPMMEVGKLPSELDIASCKSRVFKPPTMTVCKQCGDLGHCPSDKKCPVKSTEGIMETLETFRGGKC